MRTVPWYPQSRGWDAELDASIARFKYLDNKLHEMKTIPYQMCPVCYGKGFVFSLGTTNPTEACRCCNGAMIIPQYVLTEEKKDIPAEIESAKKLLKDNGYHVKEKNKWEKEVDAYEKSLSVNEYDKYIYEKQSVEERAYTENPVMQRAMKHSDLKTGFCYTIEQMEECFEQAKEIRDGCPSNNLNCYKYFSFIDYMNTKK